MPKSTVEPLSEVVIELTEKAPIRILHVDDEAGFLKASKQILEMQGAFQVDTASCVEEAMKKMNQKTYDAIVCDYIMPTKDGLQFLKQLRDSDNNTPFVFLTGKGREDVAIKALNLGADQYFSKIGSPETVYGELSHGIRRAVERRRAEERIKESQEELRAIFDATADGIAYVDTSGKIAAANKMLVEEMLGHRLEDTVGKNFAKLGRIEPKELPDVLKKMEEVIATGEPVKNFEVTLVGRNGRKVLTEINTGVVKREGKVTGITTVVRDITEHKLAEERLRESERRFRYFFENLPEYCYMISPEGKILDINRMALETLGYHKDEVVGKSILTTVYAPSSREKAKRLFMRWKKTGKLRNEELNIITNTGEERTVLLSVDSVKDDNGKVLHSISVQQDITERKKAEQLLKESEEKYRNLFENARDVTLTMDLKGKIVSINKAAVEYGFKKDEIIGKNQLRFVPKKYWPRILEELVKIAREKTVEGEVEINTPKGKRIADYRSAPIIIDDKVAGVQTILRDITEQKKAGETLRESEEKYRELINGMNDTAWVIDFDGHFIDVNDAAVEVLGYSREELLSMGPQDIDNSKTEEEIKGLIKEMPTDEIQVFETAHTTKDGKRIPVEISSSLVTYQGKQAILSIARNITKRKKAEEELKRMMEKLAVVNEKLSVVGKLTRHDARNKLCAVTANAFLARQKLAGDHEASKHLGEIESAVKQTERIFDFARIYETLGVEKLTYVDVAKTVEEAAKMFSDLSGIRVGNDCHGLTVLADSLLRQILYNLIHNSLTHGETVSQIRFYYEKAGKDQLKLVYEDDGVGIPEAEKERIFEKGYGKGTGYGLYLIRKMCEVYGWTIRETGKQSKGAQFTIAIPESTLYQTQRK